ncbi:MAG: hypothetical protein JJE30_06640 [Desulfuromonadales bacterium]|nr:hypothetical protein [Desulfuromonadales bacterium]
MKRLVVLIATVAMAALLLHAGDAVSEMPTSPQLIPIPLPPSAPVTWATLTMKNNSPYVVELYVSDDHKCTAKPDRSCTTQVSAGVNHKLSARVDGEQITSQQYTFQEDEVRTWTVGLPIAEGKVITAKDCMLWEDFTEGKCVDKEGVFRPKDKGKGFAPPTHLRCFVECGCATDQYPKEYPNCAPCGYVGITCIPR